MAYRFIIPPAGRPASKNFMLADPINHPNNTPGAVLFKGSGQPHLDSCCCGCCCYYDCTTIPGIRPSPATLTASVNGTGDCACWNGSYTLTKGPGCTWTFQALRDCSPGCIGGGPGFECCMTIQLGCDDTDSPTCPWTITAGCNLLPPACLVEAGDVVVENCHPLVMTGTVENPLCCTGTLTITITE